MPVFDVKSTFTTLKPSTNEENSETYIVNDTDQFFYKVRSIDA